LEEDVLGGGGETKEGTTRNRTGVKIGGGEQRDHYHQGMGNTEKGKFLGPSGKKGPKGKNYVKGPIRNHTKGEGASQSARPGGSAVPLKAGSTERGRKTTRGGKRKGRRNDETGGKGGNRGKHIKKKRGGPPERRTHLRISLDHAPRREGGKDGKERREKTEKKLLFLRVTFQE